MRASGWGRPLKALHFLDAMKGQRDLSPDPGAFVPKLGRAFPEPGGPVLDERQRLVAGELHVAAQADAHHERADVRVGLHEKVAADIDAGLERPAVGQHAHGRDVLARQFQAAQLLVDHLQRPEGLGQGLLEHVVDERLELGHFLFRRFLGHFTESGSAPRACQKRYKSCNSYFCFDISQHTPLEETKSVLANVAILIIIIVFFLNTTLFATRNTLSNLATYESQKRSNCNTPS